MQREDSTPSRIARQTRLAYVTSRYPAISHSFIRREVDALRARGVEVHTFAIHPPAPGDALTEADREAIATTYSALPAPWAPFAAAHLGALLSSPRRYLTTLAFTLQLPSGHRSRLRNLFHFAEAVPIWRECRRRGLQHVHAHFTSPSADVAMLVARLGDRGRNRRDWSWSFTAHGLDVLLDSPELLGEKVRRASVVLSVSEFGRAQLMGLVDANEWPKIRVVRCGIDGRRFMRTASNGVPNGDLRLLTVGRLEPEKGHEILLQATAQLIRSGLPVKLTIVGAGSRRHELERCVGELGITHAVRLAGAIGQDRIQDFYAAADVFCLPSFAEGVPVVLMEAMAMGLPVIASNLMGIPELVQDAVSGSLVPPGRPDLLARAIDALAGDPALRRKMGEAGRRKVLADFDLAASAGELLASFATVLDDRRSGVGP